MPGLRLYKNEKLCSVTAINMVFSRDAGNLTTAAFPVRAFWRVSPDNRGGAPVRFLISVPKKRLRHAVDRVKMRRRIREAYRLCHNDYPLPQGMCIDMALVYVDSALHPYARIDRCVRKILEGVAAKCARLSPDHPATPQQ